MGGLDIASDDARLYLASFFLSSLKKNDEENEAEEKLSCLFDECSE